MKNLFHGFAIMTLAALTGCSQGTPGGPGTTGTTANKPSYGQTEDTFNLTVPILSTALQQGAQGEVTIGIKRAKNFDEDVVLQFADLPEGVTIEPASPMIKHGDAEVALTFTAEDQAPVGEHKVKITGHPTNGGDAQIEFKLTIAAIDSFTLAVPSRSTSLKQGESQTVSIGIKRDKTFDQDVALEFGDLPTGVTLDPATMVLERGDTEANFKLTAADDAALGNFTITVAGHPTKGLDASTELNLTVTKE